MVRAPLVVAGRILSLSKDRPEGRSMIKGVILDMDGVIVDSEEFIAEAAIRMFAEHGVTVRPEDFIPFVGAGENRYLGGVAEKYGFAMDMARDKARTYEIYGQIAKGRLKSLPGVRQFIRRARERGLKLALASSADEIKVMISLEEIGLPPETFDVIVSGSDVERKKPDPEIFLFSARKLGLLASECLVVEDSVNGVAAAKAAGARCLALTTSFPAEKLAQADWIAPTLAEAPEGAMSNEQ
jgi:HAD superfamily hydrolase (TIGR01509 family)